MKILGSHSWYGFTHTKTGDGAITLSGRLATVSSGNLTGVAQLEKRINVRPGEVITMRVLARLSAGTRARLAIAYPTPNSPKNTEYIQSRSWTWYTVRFAVPFTHVGTTDFVNLIAGMYNEDDGTVQIKHLTVSLETSIPGARVIAAGKIRMAAGVPSINANYANHGIVEWGAATNAAGGFLVVQTDFSCRNNQAFIPLVFVQHDGQLARQVSIGAYMDASGLGRVNVQFGNPSTGGVIDMTTITALEFNLMVVA